MYITGTAFDFENRLHQQPTGSGELAQYKAEYDALLPSANYNQKGRWLKEGLKKDQIFHTNLWGTQYWYD